MEQAVEAVTMVEHLAAIPMAIGEQEQAVQATLVAAFPQPLLLQQQARLVLFQATHLHTTCSTPRISKASR